MTMTVLFYDKCNESCTAQAYSGALGFLMAQFAMMSHILTVTGGFCGVCHDNGLVDYVYSLRELPAY